MSGDRRKRCLATWRMMSASLSVSLMGRGERSVLLRRSFLGLSIRSGDMTEVYIECRLCRRQSVLLVERMWRLLVLEATQRKGRQHHGPRNSTLAIGYTDSDHH